jgi:RNA polymerase sigma factor (sigma-70 family)
MAEPGGFATDSSSTADGSSAPGAPVSPASSVPAPANASHAVVSTASALRALLCDALERYEQPLLGYALRLTGCPERARDVVQDVFLRLCRADPARLDGRLAEWLYTVCRNRASDVRRKERRMTSISAISTGPAAADLVSSAPATSPAPAAAMVLREETSRVQQAIATLTLRQQEALRLKFQAGLSYRQIALVMHTTVGNVGVMLHTAIKGLRARLRDNGE